MYIKRLCVELMMSRTICFSGGANTLNTLDDMKIINWGIIMKDDSHIDILTDEFGCLGPDLF